MNQAIIVGNLGSDPELRQTQTGTDVCTLRVATTDGKDETNWHNVVVWDKQAVACANFLSKGSKVAILGRIKYREYEKDGVRRTFTDIVAFRVEFLSSPGGGQDRGRDARPAPPGRAPSPQGSSGQGYGQDDGIPF